MWADRRGVVAAAQGSGLFLQRGGEWRSLDTGGERIDAVVRDTKGVIWARSPRHLWSLAEGADAFEDHSQRLPGASDSGYLSLDQQGILWVPTDSGLLYRDEGEWRVLGPEQGLPASWGRVAAQDREGSVWIGVTVPEGPE